MLKLNLLPREYILRSERRRAGALVAGLFAAVVAVLVVTAALGQNQKRQVAEARDRLEQVSREAAELVQHIQRADERVTAALESANRNAALVDRVPVSAVLAMMANALPEQASLTSFDMEFCSTPSKAKAPARRGHAAEPAAAPGDAEAPAHHQRIGVTGTAATDVEVANFMSNLARSPLVDHVALVRSSEKLIEDRPLREFLVEIQLKPAGDSRDPQDAEGGKTPRSAPSPGAAPQEEGT